MYAPYTQAEGSCKHPWGLNTPLECLFFCRAIRGCRWLKRGELTCALSPWRLPSAISPLPRSDILENMARVIFAVPPERFALLRSVIAFSDTDTNIFMERISYSRYAARYRESAIPSVNWHQRFHDALQGWDISRIFSSVSEERLLGESCDVLEISCSEISFEWMWVTQIRANSAD